jgi:carboxypeptidase family protein
LYSLAVSIVLMFGVSSPVGAQQGATSLHGTVTDPNGLAIAGARVVLENPARGFKSETKTAEDGSYEFLQLPPATYRLAVSAPGFKTVVQSELILQVATPATVNPRLPISTASETVTVTGAATPTINTTDASIGNAFDARQIQTLPFDGRNPAEILSLQPGAVFFPDTGKNLGTPSSGNGTANLVADSRSGSVNGGRSDQSNLALDGIDDNDQLYGAAFSGALRATLESTEEFRVTTAGGDADAGRSSGAQVNLVTRSGSNNFHGTLYEYNRNIFGRANDWFNKINELTAGEPNKPSPYIRNTYGGSIGGPILKDRLYFFFNYEAVRKAESQQVLRTIPSASLRDGVIMYQCQVDPNTSLPIDPRCNNASTVSGRNGASYNVPSGYFGLNPAQIASMDQTCLTNQTCAQPGVNLGVLKVLNTYPAPPANPAPAGDGVNTIGYTFASPNPLHQNTNILKLDYNITKNGNHRVFVRGNYQDDHQADVLQYPGSAPTQLETNGNRGIAASYTAIFSTTKANTFRYGFIRQSLGFTGANNSQDHITLVGLDDPQPFTRSTGLIVPVHNWIDDFTWVRSKHTMLFGGNLRIINNLRNSNDFAFPDAFTSYTWLANSQVANTGGSLDPAAFAFPAVDASSFQTSYDSSITTLAGLISEVNAVYQRDKKGNILPVGSFTKRHFRDHELDIYAQDSWRIKSNVTITVGARYSFLQPPYEANGLQVAPTTSLDDIFHTRGTQQQQGLVYDPAISFDLAGQANGKKPYWNWDYKNIAPRFSVAWSPGWNSGILGALFGGPGKSSVRLGYGIYFDHFGEEMANTFDKWGSFGLTTVEQNPANVLTVDNVPRFTDLNTIPQALFTLAPQPAAGFPVTPVPGNNALSWGVDDKAKTPYSHTFNFSIQRDLGHDFSIEGAYVGRLGRRLFQEIDLMMPLDLVDPQSHMDYFTAATMLVKLAQANGGAGTDLSQVSDIPFWKNMFPTANGLAPYASSSSGVPCVPNSQGLTSLTATQEMYSFYACDVGNESISLITADSSCTPACATVNGVTQPYQFFQNQFSSLYAWDSIGTSSYNALQLILRKRMSQGLQFDFNYVFSKSIDLGSAASRVNQYEGFGFDSQIVNSWSPKQLRAVSDFDVRHQFNSNWIWELPIGRGRALGSGWNRGWDAALGGWQISGLARWTSGFPFSVYNGSFWSTNYGIAGNAALVGPPPKTGTFNSTNPGATAPAINVFQDPTAAVAAFRHDYPGESGARNNLRGPGYFGIDMSLQKTWSLGEARSLRFGWDVFNITNSIRFDAAQTIRSSPDVASIFGQYFNALTEPRRMQFSLRFAF